MSERDLHPNCYLELSFEIVIGIIIEMSQWSDVLYSGELFRSDSGVGIVSRLKAAIFGERYGK